MGRPAIGMSLSQADNHTPVSDRVSRSSLISSRLVWSGLVWPGLVWSGDELFTSIQNRKLMLCLDLEQ